MNERQEQPDNLDEKTVSLNPTVRRVLRGHTSGVLPSDPLFGPKDEAFPDCTYCWGTCLAKASETGEWIVCPECRNDLLFIHVVEVDGGWFVSRDREGVWGRGECLIDALLDADRKANEGDSMWADKFNAAARSVRRVHPSIGQDVWRLVINQCNEMGLTTDEFLAEAAMSSSTRTLMRSKPPLAETQDYKVLTEGSEAAEEARLTVSPEAAVVEDVRERAGQAQG